MTHHLELAARDADDWRDIETAPLNVDLILGWHNEATGEWQMQIGLAGSDIKMCGWRHGEATHYLPLSFLPKPPAKGDKK